MKKAIFNTLKIIVFVVFSLFLFSFIGIFGANIAITTEAEGFEDFLSRRMLTENPSDINPGIQGFGFCDIGGTPINFGFPFTTVSQFSCSDRVERLPTTNQNIANVGMFLLFVQLPLTWLFYLKLIKSRK